MTKLDLSRRDFLNTVGMGSAGLIFSGISCDFGRKSRTDRPNIIFIMADDLGYNDLGCYGQTLLKTPHIDRLADEGLKFTQCYAGAAVCAPSRNVLMTGQHTGHTTVRNNKGKNAPKHDGQPGRIPLLAEDVTVAEVLKDAGYTTGITGKWGLGEPGSTGLPNDHGFDEWLGYLNQDHAPHYYTDYLWRNKEKQIIEANLNGKREIYSHDLMTEFSLEFIRMNQSRPFFLYIPYTIPHKDYEVPNLSPYENEPWTEEQKIFAAMVTRMDRDVGRIMALLKDLKIDEKTMVFFCSDNGANIRWDELFKRSGVLRAQKGSVYEGGIRTPMVVRYPGKIPAGKTSEAVWYFADVLPTLAELSGAKPPQTIDGVSILPTLLGQHQDLQDRFLYWESSSKGSQQAVRWGDWKAVRIGYGNPLELYNLKEDISESRNVADQHPDVVARIEEYLSTARTESKYFPLFK